MKKKDRIKQLEQEVEGLMIGQARLEHRVRRLQEAVYDMRYLMSQRLNKAEFEVADLP